MQTGTQDAPDGAGSDRTSEVVATMMQILDREARLFVVLHHGEGLEPAEIASVMRCTEQHVLDSLSNIEDRVRKVLRRELAEAR